MDKEDIIIVIFAIGIVILLLFLGMRFNIVFLPNLIEYEGYCKLNYNTSKIDKAEHFGRYCVEVDFENHALIKHYYTIEDVNEFCGRIKFWEFSKWMTKCASAVTGKGVK